MDWLSVNLILGKHRTWIRTCVRTFLCILIIKTCEAGVCGRLLRDKKMSWSQCFEPGFSVDNFLQPLSVIQRHIHSSVKGDCAWKRLFLIFLPTDSMICARTANTLRFWLTWQSFADSWLRLSVSQSIHGTITTWRWEPTGLLFVSMTSGWFTTTGTLLPIFSQFRNPFRAAIKVTFSPYAGNPWVRTHQRLCTLSVTGRSPSQMALGSTM